MGHYFLDTQYKSTSDFNGGVRTNQQQKLSKLTIATFFKTSNVEPHKFFFTFYRFFWS